MDWHKRIDEAADFVRSRYTGQPVCGLILGTGLGGLAEQISEATAIPYAEIPHFPQSTVESHAGQLVCGVLAGTPIVAMEGRFSLLRGVFVAAGDVSRSRDEGAGDRDSVGHECGGGA